ncbi:MAG TPA: type II secretion system F family protein [Cytophagales bacterium]|nr:type II secretion system F family protein [Cytophagales bacterium]HAA19038.1 type II secretion system F family protein [Cytophagales bacterium]HAP64549.1 type II secretion system F family protein [Cytophagales bacterium]
MAGVSLDSFSNTPPKNKESVAKSPSKGAWYNRDIQLFGSSLNQAFKETFYLEFASLLEAGLDIQRSLNILTAEQKKTAVREALEALEQTLLKGSTLSEAFRAVKGFTAYEYYSIQIGEETGQLVAVLKQLSQYFQQRRSQRKQIQSALSYPMVIMLTAIGAVSFMLGVIVPMFSDIFGRFGGELPGVTQLIISFSAGVSTYGIWVVLLLVSVGILLYVWRKRPFLRRLGAALIRRLPVIGPIVVSLHLARFCQALTLLLQSKVPLLRAIELLKAMIAFYPIQDSLQKIEGGIMQGEPLHKCLAEHSIYEHRLVSLVKVGEEVNQLDSFFERLAKQYAEQVNQRSAALNTFLEPLMIVLLGGVIGFILVAMYLPMFQLSTSFGG